MYINTPVGPMQVPQHEVVRVQSASDAELKASLYVGKNVDPFALAEQLRRGIYRNEQPQRHGGIAHQMRRMGA